MQIKIDKVSKLSLKNCKIEVDDNGNVLVIEDLGKDGIETNNFIDALEEVFGDKRFDLTISNREEV